MNPAAPASPSMLLDRLAAHDLTPWALLLRADGVVRSVMLILLLASIACWAVIIEKLVTLRRLRREVRALSAAAARERIAADLPARSGLLAEALRACIPEWRSGQGARETDGEFRGRLDHVMRRGILRALKPHEATLQILATTGAVAPFVGLFGTVWGIMNSFSGIAVSNDASLAVVAPGIAEALFATAMGLAAAIPAVVAYNRFSAAIASVRQEALAATTDLAFRFARTPRDDDQAPR